MQNTEENRRKVALAVWDTLNMSDLFEQFINQAVGRYEVDHTQFKEDAEEMGLIEEGGE